MNLEGTNVMDWSEEQWFCFAYKLPGKCQQVIMDAQGIEEPEMVDLYRQFRGKLGMAPGMEVDFSNPPLVIPYRH